MTTFDYFLLNAIEANMTPMDMTFTIHGIPNALAPPRLAGYETIPPASRSIRFCFRHNLASAQLPAYTRMAALAQVPVD